MQDPCIEHKGTTRLYKERDGRGHYLCEDNDGTIYDQIVERIDGQLEKITACKPNPNGEGNTCRS